MSDSHATDRGHGGRARLAGRAPIVERVIESLPAGPIDPALAARVERQARAVMAAEARPLGRLDRLDRLAMGWLVPIGFSLCAAGYAAELVRRLGAIYLAGP